MLTKDKSVLELKVSNHPGVMSHVCGLFSRRAFNVDGIVCLPIGEGQCSRIWLLVNEDKRLDQMVKQLSKLEDVQEIHRYDPGLGVFQAMHELLSSGTTTHVQ